MRSDFSFEVAKKLYESYLCRKGKTLDPIRTAVLRATLGFHLHFKLEDLQTKISEKIDPSVIKEIIEELIEAGLIRKILSENGVLTYEHIIGHLHHDHLVCLKCGRIQEFFDPSVESIQENIARRYHYLLIRHSHLIYGLCPECARKYADEFAPLIAPPPSLPEDGIPLSLVPAGKTVKLIAIRGGVGVCKRLQEIGINIGDEFEVVQNSFAGQFIIKIKDTRLALGQQMVHRLIVQEIEKGVEIE